MEKVLYCKYDQSRAKEFRIKTVIYEENGKRYVEKIPLCKQARQHMERFYSNYHKIKGQYAHIRYLPAEKTSQGVRYPYVQGEALDHMLGSFLCQGDVLFTQIKSLIREVYELTQGITCPFEKGGIYMEWFGQADCAGEACIAPANLDLNFSNIIRTQEGAFLAFDYEWVFNMPLPKDFVVFRALHHFYIQHAAVLSKDCTLDAFLEKCGMDLGQCDKYKQMESNMYKKICAGAEPAFEDTYQVTRIPFDTVLYEKRLLKETTDLLHGTEQEYLAAIGGWERKEQAYQEQVEGLQNEQKELRDRVKEQEESLLCLSGINRELEERAGMLEGQARVAGEQARVAGEQAKVLEERIRMLENSTSWRITRPLRAFKTRTQAFRHAVGVGLRGRRQVGMEQVPGISFPQEAHMVSAGELERQKAERFPYEPKISIITPLFNTPEGYLTDLIGSLLWQTYGNWELCLLDCSDAAHAQVGRICQRYQKKEGSSKDTDADKDNKDHKDQKHKKGKNKKIIYARGKNEGIAANTARCIEMSSGEYLGILDHDDMLHPSALYEAVRAINEEGSDFIYTDEIKFTHDIAHSFSPNFKPDFASEELEVHNYICHLNVYRRSLYGQTQGYRKEYDGSQDHDLVLRMAQKAEKITHIPKILYYWRVHQNSVALDSNSKPYASDAGIRAVNDRLTQMGQGEYAASIRNNIPCYRMQFYERSREEVSLVVWGAKSIGQVQACIQSAIDSEGHPMRIAVIESADAQEGLATLVEQRFPGSTCVHAGGRYAETGKLQGTTEAGSKPCACMQRRTHGSRRIAGNYGTGSKPCACRDGCTEAVGLQGNTEQAVSLVYVCRDGRTEAALWNDVMERYVDHYALFIHASMQVATKDIFQEMLLYAVRKDIACVDARLTMGDVLLSGGIALSGEGNGTGGVRRWKCRGKGFAIHDEGYEDYLIHARNVWTVSGCCTCFTKKAWEAVGGFGEQDCPWLLYGIRAGQGGYRNVWIPYAIADGDVQNQIQQIENMPVPEGLPDDPYYNHNIEKFGLDP